MTRAGCCFNFGERQAKTEKRTENRRIKKELSHNDRFIRCDHKGNNMFWKETRGALVVCIRPMVTGK
jgi:hypothetical protein